MDIQMMRMSFLIGKKMNERKRFLFYRRMIAYYLRESDYFTFFIPDYSVLSPIESKQQKVSGGYVDKDTDKLISAWEKEQLGDISTSIVYKTESFSYLGYKYGHLCKTFVVSTSDIVTCKKFLLRAKSIWDWQYPKLPEDICFFKNGKCIFRSVAHERLVFFDNPEIVLPTEK